MIVLLFSLCASIPAVLPMNKLQKKNVCKYEHLIQEHSKKNNLDPALLASVIYVESAFYPRVVSTAKACGLTQVISKYTGGPETKYKKYTCEQLKNPRNSIKVGAQILAYAINVYGGKDVNKGLCYYNAGNICLRKKRLYRKLYYVKTVRKIYDKIKNYSR